MGEVVSRDLKALWQGARLLSASAWRLTGPADSDFLPLCRIMTIYPNRYNRHRLGQTVQTDCFD